MCDLESIILRLEVTQQLRVRAAFAEDQSSLPSVHIRQLTTSGISRARGSDTLSWPLQSPACLNARAHVCMYTHTHIHKTQVKIKI